MAVVIASNLRKELAGSVLFDGVSFSVERRDRVALSGPNGAGKTTLLRVLSGETERHGGELAFEKGARVALHDQRPPLERELTLREYVISGARELVRLEQELARLEQSMAAGAHDQMTLNRYAAAQARLEHAGGYGWRDHAAAVVRGLGFADDDLDRPLRTFSGGELTRASLARALGGDPDLLLLDEPTNHLDVASIEWLERGEHVALVGPNGSGKTTLLETLLGQREPRGGTARLGHGVEPAYFSQHEVELPKTGTVLDAAQSATGLPRPQAQALLGRFLFSGWGEHEKAVSALSGGER